MDASTARTQNIRQLVADAGGPTAFSNRYGHGRWSQAQVSQWIAEENPKSIGNRLARHLEIEVGLPHGSLDYPTEDGIRRTGSVRNDGNAEPVMLGPSEYVGVTRVYGASLAAGSGEVLWDINEVEGSHAFRQDYLQKRGLRVEHCRVWNVRGDSMEPRYCSGDIVLIDMRDRNPVHGKVFALVGEEGLRIKQLRRTASGWEMHSFNPDQVRYPPEPIIDDNYAIIGRVRWRGGDED